jgi:NAD(P)-dependent dehydrogenase (short-subunit alcohol dehydrogenase family)
MSGAAPARTALVTGASSGVGAAPARALAAAGVSVAITYAHDEAAADALLAELGGRGCAVALRLEQPATISAAVAEAAARLGGIDVLVANAVHWEEHGPDGARRFEDVPAEEWRTHLRANVEGNLALLAAVLPVMRGREDGRILFVSSAVAEEGMPGGALVYGTAKAALHGFARSLAWDLGPEGILVNVLAIGMTGTEHTLALFPEPAREALASIVPTQRISTPDDVAAVAAFLCSPENRSITGEIVREGTAAARSPHGAVLPLVMARADRAGVA